jgi:hypothetical protein
MLALPAALAAGGETAAAAAEAAEAAGALEAAVRTLTVLASTGDLAARQALASCAAAALMACVKADGASDGVVGRGLHSFTSQLNLSSFYMIGVARRGCVARVKGVLRGV